MLPVKLSALHQIEYAIPDLDYQQAFFGGILKEQEVEQAFSQVLSNPALDIRHMGLGKTVQQFCQPLMEGLPHYDALKTFGPCVHNLCYLVDSIDNMIANLQSADFAPLIEFPLTEIWQSVIDDGNLQGNHQSVIYNTRALLGFQLELAETPWKQEPSPPLMLPAYGDHWQQQGVAGDNHLVGMSIVVSDLEQTLLALQAVFGNNLSVHKKPNLLTSAAVKCMEVELGLVRMVYFQPLDSNSFLQDIFEQRGPAVFGLTLASPKPSDLEDSLKKMNIETVKSEPILSEVWHDSVDDVDQILQINSLDEVGVLFSVIQS